MKNLTPEQIDEIIKRSFSIWEEDDARPDGYERLAQAVKRMFPNLDTKRAWGSFSLATGRVGEKDGGDHFVSIYEHARDAYIVLIASGAGESGISVAKRTP